MNIERGNTPQQLCIKSINKKRRSNQYLDKYSKLIKRRYMKKEIQRKSYLSSDSHKQNYNKNSYFDKSEICSGLKLHFDQEHSFVSQNFQEIKVLQKESENKINLLLEKIIGVKNTKFYYQIANYNFEILQANKFGIENQPIDLFKIKSDLSFSSVNVNELKNLSTGDCFKQNNSKKIVCPSPDKLINHKFYEDSENFRNENLISVNTFNNSMTTNPFSNKSDNTEMFQNLSKFHLNSTVGNNRSTYDNIIRVKITNDEEDLEYENIRQKIAHSNEPIDNKKDYKSTSNSNISESEKLSKNFNNNYHLNGEESNTSNYFLNCNYEKITRRLSEQSKQHIDIYNSQIFSDSNDVVSIDSGKFRNDHNKLKIRGFNFKNVTNTKRFSKPMIKDKENIRETDCATLTSMSELAIKSELASSTILNPTETSKLLGSVYSVNNANNNINSNPTNKNKSSIAEKENTKKLNFNNSNINKKNVLRPDTNNISQSNHQIIQRDKGKCNAIEIKLKEEHYQSPKM